MVLYILEHAEGRHMRFCPERISISRRHRNHFIFYDCRITPACGCVQRSYHTCFFSHILQCFHVKVAQFSGRNFLILHTHANHSDAGVISGGSHILRRTGIVDSPGRSRMLMFILNLNADNGSSILIIKSFQLQGNLLIQSLDNSQVIYIIGAYFQRFGKKPVGEATVTYFAVAEGADTYNDRHVMLLA